MKNVYTAPEIEITFISSQESIMVSSVPDTLASKSIPKVSGINFS